MEKFDYIIIGGGFFGCYLAYLLKKRKPDSKIVILERENDILGRASYNNQARVHNGYHYPRCLLTALRSKANFERFSKEFSGCIYKKFKQYYAVGKIQSKVNAKQFKLFFDRIGAPLKPAPEEVKKYFNKDLIEEVFLVDEYAFDPIKLKDIMKKKLKDEKVPIWYNSEALTIEKIIDGLKVKISKKSETIEIYGKYVFVCAYSNINTILERSNIQKIHLKQEMTEMAIVDVPPEFKNIGVTVMCGPFFSFMPFPPEKKHTLSHVRYTPHHYWYDKEQKVDNQEYYEVAKKTLKTNFLKMTKDASRYMPAIKNFKYKGSIWEIKTVLPQSENDDGRPILFMRDVGGIKNLICIMGGKIDNIYDIEPELDEI